MSDCPGSNDQGCGVQLTKILGQQPRQKWTYIIFYDTKIILESVTAEDHLYLEKRNNLIACLSNSGAPPIHSWEGGDGHHTMFSTALPQQIEYFCKIGQEKHNSSMTHYSLKLAIRRGISCAFATLELCSKRETFKRKCRQRYNGPKALRVSTQSTPLVKSRSFNKFLKS